jgi:pyrroline-5-carboxylate reductase
VQPTAHSIGIIGGSGMLGRAVARSLLERKVVDAANLWISNRSGRLTGFEDWPHINVTDDNRKLAHACQTIILSVPPAQASKIAISVPDKLVVSVMAAISINEIRLLTSARRVVRAMSSPAAELGLAYSPWVASPEVSAEDRAHVTALFAACGLTDEIADEAQMDCFTALTGPVPGFVAYYATCMIDAAAGMGIQPRLADRAVRQLFFASGRMMAEGPSRPGDHVQQMIDYEGMTAAGLKAMEASNIREAIASALKAAVERSATLRREG